MNQSIDFPVLTELVGCCSKLHKDMAREESEREKGLKLQIYKQKPNQS